MGATTATREVVKEAGFPATLGIQEAPQVLRIPDLMQYFNCGENTARDLCATKGFPSLKVGRVWMVPREALERWLSQQAAVGAEIATSRTTQPGQGRRRDRMR